MVLHLQPFKMFLQKSYVGFHILGVRVQKMLLVTRYPHKSAVHVRISPKNIQNTACVRITGLFLTVIHSPLSGYIKKIWGSSRESRVCICKHLRQGQRPSFLVAVGIWPGSLVHDIVTNPAFSLLMRWQECNSVWQLKVKRRTKAEQLKSCALYFCFHPAVLKHLTGNLSLLSHIFSVSFLEAECVVIPFVKGRRLGEGHPSLLVGYREIWTLPTLTPLSYVIQAGSLPY